MNFGRSSPARVGRKKTCVPTVFFVYCFYFTLFAFLRKARGRGEVERLGRRLRDEESKAAAAAAKLKNLEQHARFLETGAAAARQRAEAGARTVRTMRVRAFVNGKQRLADRQTGLQAKTYTQ